MPRPRGRPRIVRPRLSRMDAAVDAMLPLGFSEDRVIKHVKQLLKVYGGDEGWPFIEGESYRVLLDNMIEERDDEEQVKQNGSLIEKTAQLPDKSRGDEEPGCSGASDTPMDIVPSDVVKSPSAAVAETTPLPSSSPDKSRGDEEPGCSGASDTPMDIVPSDVVKSPSAAVVETTPLPASSPPRGRQRRFPCYGWIESDEDDEDEFIDLAPAPTATVERATLNVTMWKKKRRSRWDVKPSDP